MSGDVQTIEIIYNSYKNNLPKRQVEFEDINQHKNQVEGNNINREASSEICFKTKIQKSVIALK